MPRKKVHPATLRALRAGYRSGLEHRVQKQLKGAGCKSEYEPFVIPYIVPEKARNYTPDFVLANGIVIETKGRWVLEDRQKISFIKDQYPKLDLRMVFSNSKAKISKGAKSRYCDVCEKLNIPYADREIPEEWLTAKPNRQSLKIIEKLH
tara:strand:+ start:1166 stop:1615 length:450 start_codon:yes stop_codon:yes gene_type:complete